MQNPPGAYGQFFTDAWHIGNAKVENVSFGATANDTELQAVVGLGGILDTQKTSRPSLTAAFAAAGLSTTSAYSVWLGDLAGKAGSLVFGGIDTQKFRGTLTRLKTYPLQLDKTKDDRLGVQLSTVLAVSITGTDVLDCGTRPLLVEIFMGSSAILLPGDLVEAIYKEVGASTDPLREGLAIIPCHMGNSPAYFSFVFSSAEDETGAASTGPMVNISMSSLVLPSNLDTKRVSKDMFTSPQNPTCQFAIVKGTDTFGLGEAFMRSTYVVFDQENSEIGIAQSNPTPSGSYLIRFPSKGALIPLATPAASPTDTFPASVLTSSVAPLPTYPAAAGFQHWETARPPPTTNSTGPADDGQPTSSNGLAIGLGAGLPCGAVAVFTGFMAYWRIKLKRPLPILKHFSKQRWINPYATELEVKHPQPDAAEAVEFPWAFDRPVGWTELDAPVRPVELEGDYSYHQNHVSAFIPNRQDTLSSSTVVDTEEARSAMARRESMIIPGNLSAATSPIDGGGSTARDSGSYIASAITSPLRMSLIPGPDRIDIGVLGDHPANFRDATLSLPEEPKGSSRVIGDHHHDSGFQEVRYQEESMALGKAL
ncbi:hypothetical protein PG991_000786 [Apiospora marii]|uniref:Peptidase A1 domain-containing protein n=1 Tax=Apiospora marii TaxID=335849 RepID=A0ABR1SSZ9_9PEZI